MKIKELNLIGFGKFNNKLIQLEDGVNIIYGENEAGKSTLHSFINGMFYGFLRPYVTRALYLDEHSKYQPWSGAKYSGIIKFKYNNEDYLIEREFTRGNESTLVLMEKTGENITQNIDTGNRGRILQPGQHFFGFNDAVFSNTISIKQLSSKTEDQLANEVRDRLINASTSLDDNLSIERALEELDKSLKEIGTARAPTSLYGGLVKDLDRLHRDRKRVLEYKDEYDEILYTRTDVEENLARLEKDFQLLEERVKDAEILEKEKTYTRAKGLTGEIKVLKAKEGENRKYKDISMDSYTKAVLLEDRIENLAQRSRELKNQLVDIDKILFDLEGPKENKVEFSSTMGRDYLHYEELEEEKNKYLHLNNNNLEFLKRDYETGHKEIRSYRLISGLSLLLALGLGIYGTIKLNYPIIILGLLFILASSLAILRVRSLKKVATKIEIKLNKLKKQDEELKSRLVDIANQQDIILSKYKVKSKLDLKQLHEDSQFIIFTNREREGSILENKRRKEILSNEIDNIDLGMDKDSQSLKQILKDNISGNLEELKDALKKKEIYKSIVEEIREREILLDKALGKYTLDSLSSDLEDYPKDIKVIEETLTIEELREEIQEKALEINKLKMDKRGLEERLDLVNREVVSLVEIDEEIERGKKTLEDLDKKREAIELARDTIETLSRDIHRQFAPSINKSVGKIVGRITGGKYTSLRIDDQLNIGLVDPENGQLIDINSLSGGTIDQLYLALRLGIIHSIEDKYPPLILDDCFIQYDDMRLENIMKYLHEISRDRQIILFTCHKRELNILKNIGTRFNLIEL